MRPFNTILIFFLALSISCNSVHQSGHSATEKACIDAILAADSKLGDVRNHASEQASLSTAIINYTTALKKLDFSDCPKAFKEKFDAHVQAWENILVITDKYPEERGELHAVFERLEKGEDGAAFKAFVKKIWDTWAQIEAVVKA